QKPRAMTERAALYDLREQPDRAADDRDVEHDHLAPQPDHFAADAGELHRIAGHFNLHEHIVCHPKLDVRSGSVAADHGRDRGRATHFAVTPRWTTAQHGITCQRWRLGRLSSSTTMQESGSRCGCVSRRMALAC